MPVLQTGRRPLRNAHVSRPAGRLRRATLVAGAVGLTATSGLLTAGSALASSGDIEPGNLIFTPASGANSGTPTWHTTDGCPAGYRQSAELSLFSSKGVFLSRISPVVGPGDLTAPFAGTLEGSLGAILKFAQVKPGGQVLFLVGCYSLVSGTGNVQWLQAAAVTLSSSGTSYSSSAMVSNPPSVLRGPGVTGTASGPSGTGQASSIDVADASGSSGAIVAWIAAACCLLLVGAVAVWMRRRNRSQLS